ncbi:MAG: hypothetical protein WBK08_13655, partial [Nitrospira sp.]
MSQLRCMGLYLFLATVMVVSGVVCSAVSEAAEKEKDVSQEVEVPVVEVLDQSIKPRGTGTLHVDQPSPSASRLGLSIREIPASVEIVDQTLLQ